MAIAIVGIDRCLVDHADRGFCATSANYPILFAMAVQHPCPIKLLVQAPSRGGYLAQGACQ